MLKFITVRECVCVYVCEFRVMYVVDFFKFRYTLARVKLSKVCCASDTNQEINRDVRHSVVLKACSSSESINAA